MSVISFALHRYKKAFDDDMETSVPVVPVASIVLLIGGILIIRAACNAWRPANERRELKERRNRKKGAIRVSTTETAGETSPGRPAAAGQGRGPDDTQSETGSQAQLVPHPDNIDIPDDPVLSL